MKFDVKKAVLVEGLTKVSKVIAAKSTLPILQGILMEVTEQEIKLTGSDTNETISHCIPVDGENVKVYETGKTVLQKQVVDIVKKSRKEITFTLDGFTTTIRSGKGEFDLNGLDPEEYPKFPKVDLEKPTLVFNGNQFKDFIKKTAFAASDKDTRPVLKGVFCDIQGDCIKLVATDSHRLSRVTHKTSNSADIQLVVPAKSLENAIKLFDLDYEVEVFADNGQLLAFRNGPTIYLTRLIEGNYPETSRLIPSDFKANMRINRKEFLSGLEQIYDIANASDGNTKGTAKLHVNGEACLSSHQAQTGKGRIDIPYESLEGEDGFTISFAVKYAIDSLKALECEEVDFKYTDSMRPFLLSPSSDTSDLEEVQLILPVRTIES
ncbi:DNA polymerase III subunit beta [Aquibacillus sp. 3ASR75-11]|uniref:Beta sliding clamp n=1 Tax=Terrihalobacillus insolitus TaxID=2950438 RepID=A0A9X3WR73_9BACI|nr:DNA polymerase III subunit beta [Terrihalobacillus insolitus]MDC3424280.1 DNA polymerase III subunit beta [Terrihalobacillus insolitus]